MTKLEQNAVYWPHFAPINAQLAEAIAVTRRDYRGTYGQLGTVMEGAPALPRLICKNYGPNDGLLIS